MRINELLPHSPSIQEHTVWSCWCQSRLESMNNDDISKRFYSPPLSVGELQQLKGEGVVSCASYVEILRGRLSTRVHLLTRMCRHCHQALLEAISLHSTNFVGTKLSQRKSRKRAVWKCAVSCLLYNLQCCLVTGVRGMNSFFFFSSGQISSMIRARQSSKIAIR